MTDIYKIFTQNIFIEFYRDKSLPISPNLIYLNIRR